jgi:hypothetical protein
VILSGVSAGVSRSGVTFGVLRSGGSTSDMFTPWVGSMVPTHRADISKRAASTDVDVRIEQIQLVLAAD